MTYWLQALCNANLLHQLSCLSFPCDISQGIICLNLIYSICITQQLTDPARIFPTKNKNVPLILRPAGVASRTRIAGDTIYPTYLCYPQGHKGTSGSAIESSYQDDTNQFLNFLQKVACKVKVKSKVKFMVFGLSAIDSGLSIAAGQKYP